MNWEKAQISLEVFANFASVATAVLAVGAWFWYKNQLKRKTEKLENYLKEGRGPGKVSQHTVLHLMAGLGMTEDEILQASFRSRHIKRLLTVDERGFADKILFEYVENAYGR